MCIRDRVYDKTGKCMVAVSEGIHRADGTFIAEAKTSATDGLGHAQLGGLAAMLADAVKLETGAKVRGIELSLLQRLSLIHISRAPKPIPDTVYLMNHITCRAILVECGFLSNPEEDLLLQTAGYQTKLASTLAAAWLQFQELEPVPTTNEEA